LKGGQRTTLLELKPGTPVAGGFAKAGVPNAELRDVDSVLIDESFLLERF